MELFPAIDLEAGRVAGYGHDPLTTAQRYIAGGARWLHVVDLDRAFSTGRENDAWVRRLCALAGVRVQVGGNLMDPGAVAAASAWGAARVVVGTRAAFHAEQLGQLVAACGAPRAAVAIDVRQGRVALRDGGEPPVADPVALAKRVAAQGVRTVVYRDLDRDGTLAGADLDGAAHVAATGLAVIVAGGTESLAAIRRAGDVGLAGIIIGRALHEGRFTVEEALACC